MPTFRWLYSQRHQGKRQELIFATLAFRLDGVGCRVNETLAVFLLRFIWNTSWAFRYTLNQPGVLWIARSFADLHVDFNYRFRFIQ